MDSTLTGFTRFSLDEAVGSGDEGLDDSNGSDDSPDLEGDQDHQPQVVTNLGCSK
jgi:hypothetical protein